MNRRLRVAIPFVVGIVALGTGLGVVAARNDAKAAAKTAGSVSDMANSIQTGLGTPISAQPSLGLTSDLQSSLLQNALQVTAARVAQLLGTTTDELKAQLVAGKTLAAIAKDKGVSQDKLVSTILAPVSDEMGVMAKYGYVTAAQQTELMQLAQDKVNALVNQTLTDVLSNPDAAGIWKSLGGTPTGNGT
jgi:hypothetical protein